MRKTVEITTITCDICGRKIVPWQETKDHYNDTLSTAEETHQISVRKIILGVYYGGDRVADDICRGCAKKVIDFLRTLTKDENILNIPRKD